MAYSQSLADRIHTLLGRRRGLTEKTMFGGLGFLLDGNMLVGVWQTSLIARVGPDVHDQSLNLPHARQFDITGRPMKGWVLVEAEGIDDDAALRAWIDRARLRQDFARESDRLSASGGILAIMLP